MLNTVLLNEETFVCRSLLVDRFPFRLNQTYFYYRCSYFRKVNLVIVLWRSKSYVNSECGSDVQTVPSLLTKETNYYALPLTLPQRLELSTSRSGSWAEYGTRRRRIRKVSWTRRKQVSDDPFIPSCMWFTTLGPRRRRPRQESLRWDSHLSLISLDHK